MKIRTNRLMDFYLSKIGYNFLEKSIDIPSELEKKIISEFVIDNDSITLSGLNILSNPKFDVNIKKSEWEYSETHFHPDEYIESNDELKYLELALACGKQIALRLEREFKDKRFRVIISFSETKTENEEIEFYGSSSVRFYQIRNDCEESMHIKDLNDYLDDAVLEIEIYKNWCQPAV